ncbi:PRTRC system protein C [Deinococcus ruber]|uniref:PRTRC system protein C n=1 Tax=Deinococcus ruber TaxID=1848197 RepID=A0A918F7T1_9DEIO|nr:PRTRC system protein C [Deinococcus ruber]GGR13411.1 hypothetical protein GCM10008957_27960 [Deinococcus ruber]
MTQTPQAQVMKRVFKFDGKVLEDPNPKMTPEQVKQFYSQTYPELLTAGIGSPVEDLKAGTFTIELIKHYGRKG